MSHLWPSSLMFHRMRKAAGLGLKLASVDLKLLYRRTTLGPLWGTTTLAIQVAVISFILSAAFSVDTFTYAVHLTSGLVVWMLISSTLQESVGMFQASAGLIRNTKIDLRAVSIKALVKSLYGFAHNLILVALVLILAEKLPSVRVFSLFVGLLSAAVILYFVVHTLGVVGAKYSDLSGILGGGLAVLFYVTPILWLEEQVASRFGEVLFILNPILYIFDPIRLPLEGQVVPAERYLGLAVLGVIVFAVYQLVRKRYEQRVVFWL